MIYYFGGKIFEGRFVRDQKFYGFEMEEDGEELYVGHFDKGLRNGMGVEKNNKELKWGEWRDGEFRCESSNKDNSLMRVNDNSPNKLTITNTTFTSNNRVKISND